jgi:hypothetical protein
MTTPLPPTAPVVAVVIPLRELEDGERPVVRRRCGRPRRLETAPTVSDEAYFAAVAAAASAAESQDEPLNATLKGTPAEVLHAAIKAVAVESAALAWNRRQAQAAGKVDVERISSRRVNALGRLADLVVLREQLRRESQEMDPELLDRAVALFASEVEDVIREVADAPLAERFVAALRARMEAAGPPSTWDAGKNVP